MKILHTLDSLNRGGAETLVLDVCRNAGKFGIDLTFVATGGGDLEKEFEKSGVNYYRFQRKFPIDLKLVKKLKEIIKQNEIEIIHTHQAVESLHFYLASIGLKNVKLIATHHGGGLFFLSKKNSLTTRFLIPRLDANIYCSKGLPLFIRDEIGLEPPKDYHVVYNGVDTKRLEPKGNSVKKELGIKDENLLMGMTANFMPINTKDQMTVCRALPKVFEEFENANFIFVGAIAEGAEDYFDRCVKFCEDKGISEKVFFLGKRDDVPDILDSLDLFVFSTLHEGLPISLVEAMLAKLPIIATNVESVLETTNNGECAEIVEPKNADELSEKILHLLKNKELRENLAQLSFDYANENFSIEAHIRNLKKLYSSLLRKAE